ncbi:unnamed protein product, partial [Pylaiella littoralis]
MGPPSAVSAPVYLPVLAHREVFASKAVHHQQRPKTFTDGWGCRFICFLGSYARCLRTWKVKGGNLVCVSSSKPNKIMRFLAVWSVYKVRSFHNEESAHIKRDPRLCVRKDLIDMVLTPAFFFGTDDFSVVEGAIELPASVR